MNRQEKDKEPDISLGDLIDISLFQNLADSFSRLTNTSTALLDREGRILIQSGWTRLCTLFHRKNPETAVLCHESDTSLAENVQENRNFSLYKCRNGLVDVATPIIIDGLYLGNLFFGQLLMEEPDRDFFRKQAEKYGFDGGEYLDALDEIPVRTEKEILGFLDYFQNLMTIMVGMGMAKKKLMDLNQDLEKRIGERTETLKREKRFSDLLIKSLPGVMFVFDQFGRFIRWNRNFETLSGYGREQILRMSPPDFIFREDREKVMEAIKIIMNREAHTVEARIATVSGEIIPFLYSGISYETDGVRYVVGYGLDISERVKSEEEKARLIKRLEDSLLEIRKLNGLIPICSSCKKVRDDSGYWDQLEAYIQQHSEIIFSHSLCPECSEKLYSNEPWFAQIREEEDGND